ncbi:MAG: GNAT family N-acetyltransferase [Caldilineaceae bacterium]
MSRLTVRPVTEENWLAALALTVHAEQQRFTATVEQSLARAYIQPAGYNYEPMAIYVGRTMVGFYAFVHRSADYSHCILNGLLIDREHQGQGYGRRFLEHFVADMRRRAYQELLLTVHPQNKIALYLYQRLGFRATGRSFDGEAELRLPLVDDR